MMKHDEYRELVSEYIDGEMRESDAEGLFRHLSTCGECRDFLKDSLELRSKILDEVLLARTTVTEPFETITTALSVQGTKKSTENVASGKRRSFASRRINVSFATALGLTSLIVIATLLISTVFWLRGPAASQEERVVYVMSLPTVEVQGANPNDNSINQ